MSDSFTNTFVPAVERAAASVVAVHGRHRLNSSGVIWAPGLIITSDSALRRDDHLRVTLPSGVTVPATLKGRDPATDVAVLAFEHGEGAAPAFTQQTPKPGQIVFTVGRTADTGPIVTMGIISGVAQNWKTWRGGKLDEFVRLDVALYPTSVGGAVVNGAGELIGIVSGGLSRSSVIAITKSTAERVAQGLSAQGRIARGYLGVGLQPVAIPNPVKQQLNLAQDSGVMIVSVEENGPAAKAGLMMGDVLLAVGEDRTTSVEALHAALDSSTVGRAMSASFLRVGAFHQTTVTPAERPQKGA
jgi:S1-C subfamily serine protease